MARCSSRLLLLRLCTRLRNRVRSVLATMAHSGSGPKIVLV